MNQDFYQNTLHHLHFRPLQTMLTWEIKREKQTEGGLFCQHIQRISMPLQINTELAACKSDSSSNKPTRSKKEELMDQGCFLQGSLIHRFHIETKTISWNRFLAMEKSSLRSISTEIWRGITKEEASRIGRAHTHLRMGNTTKAMADRT